MDRVLAEFKSINKNIEDILVQDNKIKAAKKAAIRDQLKFCTIPSGSSTNRIIMHGKFFGSASNMITGGQN